jgi:dTDP-4-dehydrorhamnose reductase
MKIVIFGVSGQLGRDVANALSTHDVEGIEHDRADIRDADATAGVVAAERPAWVINCAAMTHVDGCELDPVAAFAANAVGARNVALACEPSGSRFLHISTDYVFNGTSPSPYVETDPAAPINAYGISKLAGEHFATYQHAGTVIVRSSGLYGTHPCRGKGGSSFVEAILARAARKEPLKVVIDERLTPTFTADLAEQLRVMIEAGVAGGVYHATNAGGCSWHEFAGEALRRAGIDREIEPARAADWTSPTRRPANSVLENRALQNLKLDVMPDWRDALARYLVARGD